MPASPSPPDAATAAQIELAVTPERLANYRRACGGDLIAAIELYRWNGELTGATWETLGHIEVLLRNALAGRMRSRQQRLRRSGSWLDDPGVGLDQRGRDDIATAQRRVRTKGKYLTDGQVVSELNFGFWRFLLARRYQSALWPDLASGFEHAPSRNRVVVEDLVVRLHEFRNPGWLINPR